MKQFIDGITPTEQEVRQAVAALDTPRKQTKKPAAEMTQSVQAESDLRVMRIIQRAFSELSTRGKGVCIEGLIREYTKEKCE